MLTLSGQARKNCDGLSRRRFFTVGSLGMGGLTLADLLRAEAASGAGSSQKSVINIHLDGGPPQMDMIDPKPDAPVEIRGEFAPIATRLPGLFVSDQMPKLASIADKFVFIRSLVGSAGRHDAFQCQSGYSKSDLESLGGRPAMGCVVSRITGRPSDVAPPFVDLMQGRPLVRNSARPGFLGPSFKPFRPDISGMFQRELEQGMKGELARLGGNHATSLTLNANLNTVRLGSRTRLLSGLDRLRRDVDGSGMMDALDQFNQQAVGILTSGRLAEAMNLDGEDPAMLARYTAASHLAAGQFTTAEGPRSPRKLLLARRLIEAGVRCVSVSISDFDTHRNNFARLRSLLPIVDHGLHALVTDLDERGMLDDVSIVVWGEFGRTPRIDAKTGGRHHWPRVGPALLAGGGMQTGQVLGSTDREAGSVISRPVNYKDVFCTLYHNLGIDPKRVTITDPQGRPQYLLDAGSRIPEVV